MGDKFENFCFLATFLGVGKFGFFFDFLPPAEGPPIVVYQQLVLVCKFDFFFLFWERAPSQKMREEGEIGGCFHPQITSTYTRRPLARASPISGTPSACVSRSCFQRKLQRSENRVFTFKHADLQHLSRFGWRLSRQRKRVEHLKWRSTAPF